MHLLEFHSTEHFIPLCYGNARRKKKEHSVARSCLRIRQKNAYGVSEFLRDTDEERSDTIRAAHSNVHFDVHSETVIS